MAGTGSGPEPRHVPRVGAVAAVFAYSTAAVMCLCGPVMVGFAVLTGADLTGLGIVSMVILVPLGLAIWCDVFDERRQNRRLDAVGVPATAEITGLADYHDGEETVVAVGLRISGPEVRAFEATWRYHAHHPSLRVGLHLTVVVVTDPAGNVFRVEF
ncbi:hypothetical protein OK074_4972 [Actinobacteria bacterium OK074]|nr:hypothetical protein OK074_4972 [Actinobacteria bacterium OK074]